MARYRFSAFATDGTPETGVLEMASEGEALERLSSLGLTVIELTLDQKRLSNFKLQPGVSLAVQADLADQLSVLFDAALPAAKVAEIVSISNGDPTVRRHFHRMGQLMADGASFSDAMEQASGVLSPLFAVLAGIGQQIGKPGLQMPQLSSALRRQERMLAQIGGALIYPAILLVGGIGVIVLMSLFLAPRLEVIFSSVNQPVPSAIAFFTELGSFLSIWGLPIAIGFAVLLFWAIRTLRNPGPKFRAFAQGLPLIGQTLRGAALARIVRAVQLMLEAGLPLAQALLKGASSFAADPQSEPFRKAAGALEDGAWASTILSADPTLPALLRELFQIGEETNTLPRVLNSVAIALENDVERSLQRLMALLTPMLTLIVGGMIAMIVASVMGAILSVNDLAF